MRSPATVAFLIVGVNSDIGGKFNIKPAAIQRKIQTLTPSYS